MRCAVENFPTVPIVLRSPVIPWAQPWRTEVAWRNRGPGERCGAHNSVVRVVASRGEGTRTTELCAPPAVTTDYVGASDKVRETCNRPADHRAWPSSELTARISRSKLNNLRSGQGLPAFAGHDKYANSSPIRVQTPDGSDAGRLPARRRRHAHQRHGSDAAQTSHPLAPPHDGPRHCPRLRRKRAR